MIDAAYSSRAAKPIAGDSDIGSNGTSDRNHNALLQQHQSQQSNNGVVRATTRQAEEEDHENTDSEETRPTLHHELNNSESLGVAGAKERQALKELIKNTARVEENTTAHPRLRRIFAGIKTTGTAAQPKSISLKYAGVSVHYLVHFFVQLVEAFRFSRSATIYEIENLKSSPGLIRRFGARVRCPRDGKMGASFTHALLALNPAHVGDATHMLSYTWGYAVGDIVDTLQEFCAKKELDPKETYVWMCFLCVNQHRVAERETAVPTREFLEEFGDRVEKIGHVICMLSPWQEPLYLQRIWCIFEFFTATLKLQQKLSLSDMLSLQDKSCNVYVVVPPRERESLARALISENARAMFREALDNVDVQKANAFEEKDRLAILDMIQSQDGGYAKTNDHVRKQLRGWVTETVSQMKKNIDTITTLTDRRRFMKCVILLVLICTYTAILVPLVFRIRGQEKRFVFNPTSSPTLAPTPSESTGKEAPPWLRSLFPEDTLMKITKDPNSPQYRAFEFLKHDISENSDYNNRLEWPNWRIQQRFGLAVFYYASNGEAWKISSGWLDSGLHECEWHAKPLIMIPTDNIESTSLAGDPLLIYKNNPCDFEVKNVPNGTYRHLSQWENDLSGELPAEVFAFLPKLQSVNLDAALYNLTGRIPSEIGQCTDLEFLSLNNHAFSAPLPASIGQMASLKFLRIYNSSLTGVIPSEIGLVSNLRYVDLRENFLNGAIPSEVGKLEVAQSVYLSSNNISGIIPSVIRQWIDQSVFNVSNNGLLSGTIADDRCDLIVFDCDADQLCGCNCSCSLRT